ncbi:ABATE domain-containing protein [Actinokineospora sp. NPDC004072]
MELPILGTEPVPVEFANTLHDGDHLGTPELANRWFAAMALPPAEPAPARALRDAVRTLLTSAPSAPLDAAAVAVVNACAAPGVLRLGVDRSARWVGTASGSAAVLGGIAAGAIELLAGRARVLPCPAPGCGLLFLQRHARRRFCHPACGHRDRQARYYRRRNPR